MSCSGGEGRGCGKHLLTMGWSKMETCWLSCRTRLLRLEGGRCILEHLSPTAEGCAAALGEEGLPGTLSAAGAARWDELMTLSLLENFHFPLGDGGAQAQVLCVRSRCWPSHPCAASGRVRSHYSLFTIRAYAQRGGPRAPHTPASRCSQPKLFTPVVFPPS